MDKNEVLEQLLAETKKLSKLVAISITSGLGSAERICLLGRAGLAPKDIAETLGISSNLVSVTLHKEKKKKDTTKEKTK